ncbi:syntaxin 5 protein [Dioscorea alata]|uniref:Syntaxin 5 protein n=1 Tax=Dioscorea alata TaxID=55571 RepID=A0ACB7VG79_DIOAL|nr:syntaxin 5 protein [Dioscorea alata]
MASSFSSYRDRTSEFRSFSETLKKVQGLAADSLPAKDATLSLETDPIASRSEFNRKASRIGLGIHETSQKIAKLSKFAKRSSMFDDPTVEIQELSAIIKNDITALNISISDLQVLQNTELADMNSSKDRVVHATTICDDLKSRLMGATKQFKDVLTARTENLKAHENRKQIFSTNASRENPLMHQPKTVSEPPPWSNAATSLPSSVTPVNGLQQGNQLRRRLAAESTSLHHPEMSMMQQVVPRQENYTQSRAVALQNVESTISELGGIFTQLATMVAQQGELAIRIDDNMDDSLTNIEGARSALLKHLTQISSNSGPKDRRWRLLSVNKQCKTRARKSPFQIERERWIGEILLVYRVGWLGPLWRLNKLWFLTL